MNVKIQATHEKQLQCTMQLRNLQRTPVSRGSRKNTLLYPVSLKVKGS